MEWNDTNTLEEPSAGEAAEDVVDPVASSVPLRTLCLDDTPDDPAQEDVVDPSLGATRSMSPKPVSAASKSKPEPKPQPEPVVDLPVVVSEEDQRLIDQFFATQQRDRLNVVFIGHVDAGKSTMGGNILYLTGMVDKRTLEKYEREAKEAGRESWYLSWALDTYKEERAKGKTVETGRAYFETEKRKYTILDAPGHKNYVPSMIQGAAQADVAILVISARRGEFEAGFEGGGQTREHAMLVKTAGVRKLIVAINKMDDPTVGWAQDRYEECKEKLVPFLKKECKFNLKTDVVFLPVSGFSGANLKDRVDASVCAYYRGPSLLEILDAIPVDATAGTHARLIVPVAEKYKDMGTMVAGKIESGFLKKGHAVCILPNRLRGEVLQILVDEEEVPLAQTGDSVHLKLKNIEEEDIVQGSVLCSPSHPLPCVSTFDAQLLILNTERIITAGYQAVMHLHHAVEDITIAALLHSIDKKTGKRTVKPPRFLTSGSACIARIETLHPICIDTFKNTPQMGRFIIRLNTATVAMGKVVKLITE